MGAHIDSVESRARIAGIAAADVMTAGLDLVDLAFVPREDSSIEAIAEEVSGGAVAATGVILRPGGCTARRPTRLWLRVWLAP